MSLKVIELNDHNIKVGDENGIIFQSPGFALATETELEFGKSAEQQARLQPTKSYNKYWHELNLEPFSHDQKVRHHADLAFAQLVDLAEKAEIDGEVIFAVPGSFTQQQLGVLLGLAQQTAFSPVGFVDSALVASAPIVQAETVVYVDIHLHQAILTKLAVEGKYFKTESTAQVPGAGKLDYMNLMMQLATELFIEQCRFNPQYNAHFEQKLYNELPSWVLGENNDQTLFFELKSEDTIHRAKVPRERVLEVLGPFYQKINTQIKAMITNASSQLLISEALCELPGYSSTVIDSYKLELVHKPQINEAVYSYLPLIISSDEKINLVKRLKMSEIGAVLPSMKMPSFQEDLATHLLYASEAIEISNIEIRNFKGECADERFTNVIQMHIKELPEKLGSIDRTKDGIFFTCDYRQAFLNNKLIKKGKYKVRLGDNIKFVENGGSVCLIKVHHGK